MSMNGCGRAPASFVLAINFSLCPNYKGHGSHRALFLLDCHLSETFFVSRRTWASRAKRRALCDALIARLARFHIRLHPPAKLPSAFLPHRRRDRLFHASLPQKLRRFIRRCGINVETRAPLKSRRLG